MTDELIPSGEPSQEGQPPQEPQPEPQPQPETDVLIRFRGEDIPVPMAGLEALAAAFKTTPERAAARIQMLQESNHAWNMAEKEKQRADALEQQWQQHLQGTRQQPPQPQYQPQPYQAPPAYSPATYGAPPSQQYQPPQPGQQDDPIQLLHLTRQEIAQMRRDILDEREQFKQAREREALEQDRARWQSAGDRFLEEKNKGRKTPITFEQLRDEIALSGMHLGNMAPERVFDKAWRVITYDEAGQTAENKLMTRLREPTAKVMLPGAPSTMPPPQSAKPKEPDFGNITMRDVFEHVPITKNL